MHDEIRFIGTIDKKDENRYYILIPADVLKDPEVAELVRKFAEEKTDLIIEVKLLHGKIRKKTRN